MPRYDDSDDLPDGVYHDDEWPTVPCKYCREEIAEDSEQCPKCGQYQSSEDAPAQPMSRFVVVVMVLALACAAFWAMGK